MQDQWICVNCGRVHGDHIFYCRCGDTERAAEVVSLDQDKDYVAIAQGIKFYYHGEYWVSYDLEDGDVIESGLSAEDVLKFRVVDLHLYSEARNLLTRTQRLYGDIHQPSLFQLWLCSPKAC